MINILILIYLIGLGEAVTDYKRDNDLISAIFTVVASPISIPFAIGSFISKFHHKN